MQNATDVKSDSTASQSCSIGASGGRLDRRALYIALGVGGAAGLFLGWDWLVAVGAASLIIAIAPCLVMCALGLCMSRACQHKKAEAPAKADAVIADDPVTRTAAANSTLANAAVEAPAQAAPSDAVDPDRSGSAAPAGLRSAWTVEQQRFS